MRRVSENVTRCSQGMTRGFTEEEKYECSPMDYSQVSTQESVSPSFDTGLSNTYQNNESLFQTPTQITPSNEEYDLAKMPPLPPPLNRTKTSVSHFLNETNSFEYPLESFTQPDFDMELSELGSQELVEDSEQKKSAIDFLL